MTLTKPTNVLTKIGLLASLTLVAACGGGSSGGNGSALDDFDTIISSASAQSSTYLDSDGQPLAGATRAADSVLAGQSGGTFDGFISGATDEGAFVATLELTVDFADADLTGTATDFRFEDDTVLTGSVTGAGSINTNSPLNQVDLTLTGPLTESGTARTTSLALDGDFYQAGTDATGAVAGEVDGSIGSAAVLGLFSAER